MLDSPAVEAALTDVASGDILVEAASRRALKRFMRHRVAVAGALILVIIALLAAGAGLIASNPLTIDPLHAREAPSAAHWLGTDAIGRDVFARVLYGGRISLVVGVLAVAIYLVIGTLLGALAGFYGGWVEVLIMRVTDVVLSFPALIVVLVLVAILGPGLGNIILVIALLGWPPVVRLVRAMFLSLRELEYVQAARALGAPDRRLIAVHMLPAVTGSLAVAGTFGMAQAILLEAALSFLGVGVQPPTPSWGNMLTDAQSLDVLQNLPWLWLPPGLAILLVVLSVNAIGDGLRDAFDPGA